MANSSRKKTKNYLTPHNNLLPGWDITGSAVNFGFEFYTYWDDVQHLFNVAMCREKLANLLEVFSSMQYFRLWLNWLKIEVIAEVLSLSAPYYHSAT